MNKKNRIGKPLKGMVSVIPAIAVGSAVNTMVGNSSMASGFKEATQIGVSAGVMAHTYKGMGLGKKKGGNIW